MLCKKFGVVDHSPFITQVNESKRDIDVIGIYSEGLLPYEGIRLMNLVARAREMGKVVVVYKAGRSKEGSDAVAGHTAALAGSYDQFYDLLDMAGACVADTIDSFEDAVLISSFLIDRLRKLPKLVLSQQFLSVSGQSNAGFERCGMADHLFHRKDSNRYLKLPDFDEAASKKLHECFIKYKLGAVIDVQQILDTTALIPDAAYAEIAGIMMGSGCVNAAILSMTPEVQTVHTLSGEFGAKYGEDCEHDENSVIQRYIKLFKEGPQIPWVMNIGGGFKYNVARELMFANGIPVFHNCDRGCRGLVNVLRAWVGRYGFLQ